jgi:hypothetical protein
MKKSDAHLLADDTIEDVVLLMQEEINEDINSKRER